MTREEKTMKRVKEHYEELQKRIKENNWECEILGVFLQGSQNYGLSSYSEDYMSDVDTKAIVIPSFKDLIYGKRYSTTLVLDNDEHIDVKDIQTMVEMFHKQNTSYIELLFTDFMIINPKYENEFKAILNTREDIARICPKRHALALMGSAHNKFKAMTHVSPHSKEKIEKFGYDPKELCHLIRYHSELIKYIENEGSSYKECLLSGSKEIDEYLMRVKKGIEYTAEEAIMLGARIDEEMKQLAESYSDNSYNEACVKNMNLVMENIIHKKISEEAK